MKNALLFSGGRRKTGERFPIAVNTSVPLRGGAPRGSDSVCAEINSRPGENQDADELRGGEAEHEAAVCVAAQIFKQEAPDGIHGEIQSEQLSPAQAAPQQGEQREKEQEAEQRPCLPQTRRAST